MQIDSALRDNFQTLSWDSDQKATAKEFFYSQWRATLDSSTRETKGKIDEEISSKLELATQLQNFHSFFISVKDQGSTVQELADKFEVIRAQFNQGDAQLAYLLTQPPLTFSESFKNINLVAIGIYLNDK